MSSLARRCPADIPRNSPGGYRELAVATFQALGCLGVSRIDFLNDRETGELWVNEINTIPGSLAFYLWEAAGVPFAELLDRCSPSRSAAASARGVDLQLMSTCSPGFARRRKKRQGQQNVSSRPRPFNGRGLFACQYFSLG